MPKLFLLFLYLVRTQRVVTSLRALHNTISVGGADFFIDYRPFLLFYFVNIPGKSNEKKPEKKVSLFADRRCIVKRPCA